MNEESQSYSDFTQTQTYTDFIEMVDAIAAHTKATGDHVLPADSPPHLGYLAVRYADLIAPERAVLFQIHAKDIGPSLARYEASGQGDSDLRRIKVDLLRQAVKTSAGRLRLAVSFPGQAIDQPDTVGSQKDILAALKSVNESGPPEPTSTLE
jgi:hypothetical protein